MGQFCVVKDSGKNRTAISSILREDNQNMRRLAGDIIKMKDILLIMCGFGFFIGILYTLSMMISKFNIVIAWTFLGIFFAFAWIFFLLVLVDEKRVHLHFFIQDFDRWCKTGQSPADCQGKRTIFFRVSFSIYF